MSDEEMVFEEVSYREPERLNRPDLDRRFACIAYEVPGPDDMPIFLDRKPADAIERHALRDTSVELGGILLGKECVDEETGKPFVWVTDSLEAKHYENTQASFTYTHDSWQEITRERDEKHPDLNIVGWYHTHPDFGVFLSSHDLFIHHHFFAQPLQVAYVVDPIRQTRSFFQWRGGEVEQQGGFYLSADRGERQALARLVNDLESIPNTEGGGGSGLSPRLEAELIAMLTRPHHAPAAVDRGQTAAVFSMLGILIGVVLMMGGVWLNSLHMAVREQAAAVKGMEEGLKKSAKSQDDEVSTQRLVAKEEALDALLKGVRVGDTSESFVANYTKIARERDEAKAALEKALLEKEALGDVGVKLHKEQDRLLASSAETKKKYDKLSKEADGLVEDQKAKYERLDNDYVELTKIIEDGKTGRLYRKYLYAWYTAAGAIVVCVLLCLGVVALVARVPPEEGKPASEDRPHTIT